VPLSLDEFFSPGEERVKKGKKRDKEGGGEI